MATTETKMYKIALTAEEVKMVEELIGRTPEQAYTYDPEAAKRQRQVAKVKADEVKVELAAYRAEAAARRLA